jgi:hypothetical protein
MASIKVFGLAALAALMAMMFIDASSAMAEPTVLCSNDSETSCSEVTHVHETSVGKGKLLFEILPTVECTVLLLGDTGIPESSPLLIYVKFTYTSCNNFCSVQEENGIAAESRVLKTGHETAGVTDEAVVHVNCPFINCSFSGMLMEGTAKGPLLSTQKNGEVSITEQLLIRVAGSCTPTVYLDLTTTPLITTYIKTVECSEVALGYYLERYSGECTKVDLKRLGSWEKLWR